VNLGGTWTHRAHCCTGNSVMVRDYKVQFACRVVQYLVTTIQEPGTTRLEGDAALPTAAQLTLGPRQARTYRTARSSRAVHRSFLTLFVRRCCLSTMAVRRLWKLLASEAGWNTIF